jgi:hypothetical protein
VKQDVRVEIDSKGRKRTLLRTCCTTCKTCWLYTDTQICIYGGPFSGYVDADPNDPAPRRFAEIET